MRVVVLLPLDCCRYLPGASLSRLDVGGSAPAQAVLPSPRRESQADLRRDGQAFFSPGSKAVTQQRLELLLPAVGGAGRIRQAGGGEESIHAAARCGAYPMLEGEGGSTVCGRVGIPLQRSGNAGGMEPFLSVVEEDATLMAQPSPLPLRLRGNAHTSAGHGNPFHHPMGGPPAVLRSTAAPSFPCKQEYKWERRGQDK